MSYLLDFSCIGQHGMGLGSGRTGNGRGPRDDLRGNVLGEITGGLKVQSVSLCSSPSYSPGQDPRKNVPCGHSKVPRGMEGGHRSHCFSGCRNQGQPRAQLSLPSICSPHKGGMASPQRCAQPRCQGGAQVHVLLVSLLDDAVPSELKGTCLEEDRGGDQGGGDTWALAPALLGEKDKALQRSRTAAGCCG